MVSPNVAKHWTRPETMTNNHVIIAAYMNSVLDRHHGSGKAGGQGDRRVSAATTNAQLSRLFSTCIRELVHLLSTLRNGTYMGATTLGTLLEVSYQVSAQCSMLRGWVVINIATSLK